MGQDRSLQYRVARIRTEVGLDAQARLILKMLARGDAVRREPNRRGPPASGSYSERIVSEYDGRILQGPRLADDGDRL
jgi:hypothetical protein